VTAAVGHRRGPQEKKALSYAKDRRNDYGENDKSSRKSIRRRKRDPNRSDRHRERQVLANATGVTADPVLAEDAERALVVKKSKWYTVRWRKRCDAPLAGAAPSPDAAHRQSSSRSVWTFRSRTYGAWFVSRVLVVHGRLCAIGWQVAW
jgi:hypothetical protein